MCQLHCVEALPTPGDSDDIIGDSEDEATKNFKGMVRTQKPTGRKGIISLLRSDQLRSPEHMRCLLDGFKSVCVCVCVCACACVSPSCL